MYFLIKFDKIGIEIGKVEEKMNKILKYFLVFVFLFLMNIFIFKILATLGFQLTMSEKSYIVPPLFSIIVLYMIDKRIRKKKK
ncbi:hypothetical protein SMIC22_00640 [Streptococcus mitis]